MPTAHRKATMLVWRWLIGATTVTSANAGLLILLLIVSSGFELPLSGPDVFGMRFESALVLLACLNLVLCVGCALRRSKAGAGFHRALRLFSIRAVPNPETNPTTNPARVEMTANGTMTDAKTTASVPQAAI